MGIFDGILKGVGGIAKAVSPIAPILQFIPGAQGVGAAISALGALSEQADARRKAEGLYSNAGNVLGINPFITSLQGRIGGGDVAGYRQFLENASLNARSAGDQYIQSLADRGLAGGPSSSAAGGLARIYGDIPLYAAQGFAKYNTDLNNSLLNAAGVQNSMNLSQAQGMGGIGNYYASKSDALGNDMAVMQKVYGPELGKAGQSMADWIMRQTGLGKRPATAGQTTLPGSNTAAPRQAPLSATPTRLNMQYQSPYTRR